MLCDRTESDLHHRHGSLVDIRLLPVARMHAVQCFQREFRMVGLRIVIDDLDPDDLADPHIAVDILDEPVADLGNMDQSAGKTVQGYERPVRLYSCYSSFYDLSCPVFHIQTSKESIAQDMMMCYSFKTGVNMIRTMYPFWSAILAAVLAQFLKPFVYYFRARKWKWYLMKDSGGFPSSHSALVSALALSVGFHDRFSSTIFAVTLALAVIVIYDAANVRYYSGQNIKVTQQLVKDLQETQPAEFTDPIYFIKMKTVLGHKWIEVIGGIALGCIIALIFHYCM